MKKEHKYGLYLGFLLVVLIAVEYLAPKPLHWVITFYKEDKNPFGAYVLNEVLADVFPGQKIIHYYNSLYELQDTLTSTSNVMILATQFSPDSLDVATLLEMVNQGGNALIGANYYNELFADTLNLRSEFSFRELADGEIPASNKQDSFRLNFVNPMLTTDSGYVYHAENVPDYFESFDTLRTTILAENSDGHPVFIKTNWGKGSFFLTTVPLIYSNYCLLDQKNYEFASKSLSYLPTQDLHWFGYYQMGRMESPSPLRFVLSTPPLRWALYITLTLLLLFILFEAKRKQRYIPVIIPPANSSLDFVKTVSQLFYRNKHHKNIADKKIIYFSDYIRTRYRLHLDTHDEKFRETLTKKSGKEKETIDRLLNLVQQLRQKQQVSEKELLELNRQIETFYDQNQVLI